MYYLEDLKEEEAYYYYYKLENETEHKPTSYNQYYYDSL